MQKRCARGAEAMVTMLWKPVADAVMVTAFVAMMMITVEYGLASLLIDQKAYGEAEPLLREALELLHEGLPDTRWQVVDAQSTLGVCLAGQGRFEEAEPILRDGYDVLREERGLEDDLTQQAVERLVDLYEEWGRAVEAQRYVSQLLEHDD